MFTEPENQNDYIDTSSHGFTTASYPMVTPPAKPKTADEVVRAGRALLLAKKTLNRKFVSWVKEYCPFSPASAYNYMARASEAGSGFDADPAKFKRLRSPVMDDWPALDGDQIDGEATEIMGLVNDAGTYSLSSLDEMFEPVKFTTEIADRVPNATPADLVAALDRASATILSRLDPVKRVRQYLASLPDQDAMLWHTPIRDDVKLFNDETRFDQIITHSARDCGWLHCRDVPKDQQHVWRSKITEMLDDTRTGWGSSRSSSAVIWRKYLATEIVLPDFPIDDAELDRETFASVCGNMLYRSFHEQKEAIVRQCVVDDWDAWRSSQGRCTYDQVASMADQTYREFADDRLRTIAAMVVADDFQEDEHYREELEGFWPVIDELVPFVSALSVYADELAQATQDAIAEIGNESDSDVQAAAIKARLFGFRISDSEHRWSVLRAVDGLPTYDQLPVDQKQEAYQHFVNVTHWLVENGCKADDPRTPSEQFGRVLQRYWPDAIDATDQDEIDLPF